MFDEGSTSDPHHTPRIDAPRTRQHTEARFVLVSRALPGLPTLLSYNSGSSFRLCLSRSAASPRLSSSFILPSLFAHIRALGFSLRLSRSALLPSLSLFSPIPSAAPLSPRCIPMSVKPIAAWNDRHGPEMGIDGVSATSDVRPCVREYGSTRREYCYSRDDLFREIQDRVKCAFMLDARVGASRRAQNSGRVARHSCYARTKSRRRVASRQAEVTLRITRRLPNIKL